MQRSGHAPSPPDPGPEIFTSSCNVELAAATSAFSACIILVNASHDRLAHNQGPCYRPAAAAHRTDKILLANSSLSAALSHMHDKPAPTSPHAHTCTPASQSSPPHIYGIWHVLLLAAIALPALASTASRWHTLCGHEMIHAAEQLGEQTMHLERHWIMDGGVRQFSGL